MTCQYCGERLIVANAAHTDLAGQTFCGDGTTRHQPAVTGPVPAVARTIGWEQPVSYTDPWGRTA